MFTFKICDKPSRLPRSVFFERSDGYGLSLPLRFTFKYLRAYYHLIKFGYHRIEIWK